MLSSYKRIPDLIEAESCEVFEVRCGEFSYAVEKKSESKASVDHFVETCRRARGPIPEDHFLLLFREGSRAMMEAELEKRRRQG